MTSARLEQAASGDLRSLKRPLLAAWRHSGQPGVAARIS